MPSKVAGQIETPRPPDPILRRSRADREEKRVTHGRDRGGNPIAMRYRGRDAGCPAPPAQIRTGGFPAYGSYLGYLTAKRSRGHGWRILGLGSQSAASFSIRRHVEPSFSLRR